MEIANQLPSPSYLFLFIIQLHTQLSHNGGMEDEICPYATFHLLGFREEMDPTKAMNFQTFPHQNGHGAPGHVGTMGPPGTMQHPGHVHSRSGSQSMVSVSLLPILSFLLGEFTASPLLAIVFPTSLYDHRRLNVSLLRGFSYTDYYNLRGLKLV